MTVLHWTESLPEKTSTFKSHQYAYLNNHDFFKFQIDSDLDQKKYIY